MKLNSECIRDILLALEQKPFAKRYTVQELEKYLPDYSVEELYYTCLKLDEGGYISLSTIGYNKQGFLRINTIDDLTFQGHEFLEKIREQSIWDKTMSIAKSTGSFSLKILGDIAAEVIKAKFTKFL